MCIAGNKCDMDDPEISEEELYEFAKSQGCPYFMTSAYENIGTDVIYYLNQDAFLALAKNIHAANAKPDDNKQPSGKEDKVEKGMKLKNIKKDEKEEANTGDRCKC